MLHLNNFPELGGRSTSHIRSNFSSSISLTEATWDILPKYSPNSSWAEWRSSASTTRLKYHLRVLLQRLARPLRKLQTWLNRSKYVTVILNHFFSTVRIRAWAKCRIIAVVCFDQPNVVLLKYSVIIKWPLNKEPWRERGPCCGKIKYFDRRFLSFVQDISLLHVVLANGRPVLFSLFNNSNPAVGRASY